MKRISIALTLSCALAAASLGAAPGQDKPKDPKLGTRVTIRGCLHDGQGHDNFVMLGITERPGVLPADAENVITPPTLMAATGTKPPVPIYWLTTTEGLKERVGHVIDITGIVEEKKTKTGTITVSIDPDIPAQGSLIGERNKGRGDRQVPTPGRGRRTIDDGVDAPVVLPGGRAREFRRGARERRGLQVG